MNAVEFQIVRARDSPIFFRSVIGRLGAGNFSRIEDKSRYYGITQCRAFFYCFNHLHKAICRFNVGVRLVSRVNKSNFAFADSDN